MLANDIGKQENVIKELAIKQSSNLSQFDLGKWVDMRCVKHRPGRFSDMLPAVMRLRLILYLRAGWHGNAFM